MVLASRAVLSDIFLAARPVGAASKICTLRLLSTTRMLLSSVVLPTPGPPVITITLDATAIASASFWVAPSEIPTCKKMIKSAVSKVLKPSTVPMFSLLYLCRGLVRKASSGTHKFVRKLFGTAESSSHIKQ